MIPCMMMLILKTWMLILHIGQVLSSKSTACPGFEAISQMSDDAKDDK